MEETPGAYMTEEHFRAILLAVAVAILGFIAGLLLTFAWEHF